MKTERDSTQAGAGLPAGGELISIYVPDQHPLLQLKEALDWEAIRAVMIEHWRKAGKNVSGGRGLAWPVELYVPLLVLMWVKAFHARQMEEYLNENVVARRFLGLSAETKVQIRDHANLARADAALGAQGKTAVNRLVIGVAQECGFAEVEILSSDTTVQEPAIGYPNEPGILKGLAERVGRALKKLKQRGVEGAKAGIKQTREMIKKVKEHHLFAKTKEEKTRLLRLLVEQAEVLLEQTRSVIGRVSARCGGFKQRAKARLQRMVEVGEGLLPQIRSWMKTGKVAREKIIHAGIPAARAIVKGKRQVKFGMKWLINRVCGGYLFGRRVEARADENKMPEEGLKDYREVFGAEATPEMVVYDRGASLPAAAETLQQEGVRKIGIPPRGQGAWMVGEKDQKAVKSHRGQTEGSIGRLKHRKYGFSHRQERSLETQDAAGQRAIVSVNLNTLMRDLIGQAKAAQTMAG